ncbi:type II toxin-antitoxin system RelE/ParE family toxin [Prosthecobacter sp. SYSU 5D2]
MPQAQIGRIMERAEWLAANPVKSHPIHEFPASGWLDAHVGNYRIIHKIAGDELRIGLVLHRKQLLKRSLLR